jgi:peptidoglycan hydrolase-like protein with peptidoglycan-binding domain
MLTIKKLLAASVAAGFLVPSLAFAQATTTPSVSAVVSQIQALEAQIAALQAQIKTLQDLQKGLAVQQKQGLITLLQTLKEGSSGDQVAALQALLALDPSIYPEGKVSGFFGRLTADAVKRFQKKHGIEQAGVVGPKTLKKLNELLRELENEDKDDDKGEERITFCHKPSGGAEQTITVKKSAALAHFMHGDVRGACGGTTTTDVLAPVISNITTTGVTSTSAIIGWTTNEGATSQVEYGPTNSYTSTTTLNAALTVPHAVGLSGLAASTLYHFRVLTKDASGNLASSGDMTFTTSATPDTTAPIISAVNVSAIGSVLATVGWTTNESATGKVYYSTISPVDLGTALNINTNALSTGHSFGLTGLTASTTYHYVVESKDVSNNTATTTPQSFTTAN